MDKKKILIFVTQLEAGGAQRAAINLKNGLKANSDVKLFFLYEKERSYLGEDYTLIYGKRPTILTFTKFLRDLYKVIQNERPDVLISFTYYANVIVSTLGLLLGTKVRIASQRNPSTSYPYIAKALDFLLGVFGGYTHNVMVSRSVSQSFSSYPKAYKKRIAVIPNGVNYQSIEENKLECRNLLGLSSSAFVIVNVGRLSRQKNQETLLRAVENIDGVVLLLIGEGELRDELEKKSAGIEDKVRLLGQLDSRSVKQYLVASDLFAFPSLYEGMSNALLEALSAGLAVVASDTSEQKEVLSSESRDYAILLPADEVARWEKVFFKLSNDLSLLKKYADLSKERGKDFSMDKMISNFEKLFCGE